MKTQVVGHSAREGVQRDAKILNRVVRATQDGWEYECDQRHVEIILEQLGLTTAQPLGTPGVEETKEKGSDEAGQTPVPLDAEATSLYRAITARANYVAQDRPDIQYAVKELCRRTHCQQRLVRLGRYLRGRPRAVALFPWQTCPGIQDVFTDASWQGAEPPGRALREGQFSLGLTASGHGQRPNAQLRRAVLSPNC